LPKENIFPRLGPLPLPALDGVHKKVGHTRGVLNHVA